MSRIEARRLQRDIKDTYCERDDKSDDNISTMASSTIRSSCHSYAGDKGSNDASDDVTTKTVATAREMVRATTYSDEGDHSSTARGEC